MFEPFYRALESVGYFHPIHPTLINMPIGLTVGAFILGIFGWFSKRSGLFIAAKYAVILAFFFLIPTAIAGFMDWQHYYEGVWLHEIQIKAGLATGFFLLLMIAVFVIRKKEFVTIGVMVIFTFSLGVAVSLGYFGGELTFGGRAPAAPREYKIGEFLFRGDCSGCHPHGANILKPKMPIIASDRLDNLSSFVSWIRNPEDPMPEFPPDEISENQSKALYDYITYLWGSGNGHGGHGADESGEHHENETARSENRIGAEVRMTDSIRFDPENVTIDAGEAVKWENTSDIVHTVTADPTKARDPDHAALPEGAKTFDSGDIRPDGTFIHTFEKPGHYRYFCIPHEIAGMIGEVEVK